MLGFLGRRRRRRLRARPFPEAWREILLETFPAYARADDDVRSRVHPLVNVFVGEKRFEGAGGQRITDEIRVSIAAQACWILIGIDPEQPYPRLRTIIVYPWPYVASSRQVSPAGVVTEERSTRSGESWSHMPGTGAGGPVVLAWDEVTRGARRPHDGRNVVYHEFAHRLDALATGMDGAPSLGGADRYDAWSQVLGRHFEALRADLAAGRQTTLRPYGATSPAEFFAVATEMYFERPGEMRRELPDLFEQLLGFYKWDPAGDPGRD